MPRSLVCCLVLFAAANLLVPPTAQAQRAQPEFDLPANPFLWLNSQPWSVKQLAGKSALLFFFEEDCPKCRRRWPELNQLVQSHAEDPILFIAVSSGTNRNEMQNYARQNQVNWTVLLDPDRSFEKACDVNEISLENIMQVAIIGPDGAIRRGDWSDLEASATKALEGAAWTVDPQTIPDNLKPAWQLVEFRNYAPAASLIRKALKSQKDETRAGAEALMAVVQPLIDERLAAADAAFDAGEKWMAFQAYGELLEQFKGYELPETVEDRKKELQSDPAVKTEAAAMKSYLAALRQLENPAQHKRGLSSLKKLAKDKPDTAAGKLATEQLDAQGENS